MDVTGQLNTDVSKPVINDTDVTPSKKDSIITLQTKGDIQFREQLAALAKADAQHDLEVLTNEAFTSSNNKLSNAFNAGLPENATTKYHEGQAFASIASGIAGENELLKKFHEVPDVTFGASTPELFTVGYKEKTIFTYKVVKFITQSSTNMTFKLPDKDSTKSPLKPCEDNFGDNFFTNTELGGGYSEVAIIVDFAQHHFLERLVEGAPSNFIIHYLMTPEVVNDPAGKPNVHNKSLFGHANPNGLQLNSYVQRDPSPQFYTKFDASEPNPSNNFFSNYDFTLSPIKQIYTKQKAEKFITTLDIKYDNGKNKPLTDTIEDSKGENSITTVLGYINKLIKQITSSNDDLNDSKMSPIVFNFNSKCQQKRGGDWFQALSCLDVRNRTFTQILPDNDRSEWVVPPKCPVYFVTHDRIAVAFALLNGVNVIYQDYYGRIFVFKNTEDPTLQGIGKPIDEILFEGMKATWVETKLSSNLTTATRYNEIKNDIIKMYNDIFNDAINNMKDGFAKLPSTLSTSNQGPFMKSVTTLLRNMFATAVQLMFVKTNLFDITEELQFINQNKALLQKEYIELNEQEKALINKLSKSLNAIKSIENKFGVMGKEDTGPLDGIRNWITINVPKLDVYRAAKNLTLEISEDADIFDIERLKSFNKEESGNERVSDKYIFLPFIQTLDVNTLNEIVSSLKLLTPKLNGFLQTVKEYIASNTSSSSLFSGIKNSILGALITNRSRGGQASSQLKFYNSTANLIYESFIILYTAKNPEPQELGLFVNAKDSIIVSESCDVAVVSEDLYEINLLKNGDKNSNYNDVYKDDADLSQSGGASYSSFDSTSMRIRSTVVCDVGIKQITRPLMTNIVLDSVSEEGANTIITHLKDVSPIETTDLDYINEMYSQFTQLKNASPIMNNDMQVSDEPHEDMVMNNDMPSESTTSKKRKGFNDENMNVVGELLQIAKQVNKKIRTMGTTVGGGDINTNNNLLHNFDLGYHPLFPIYILLSSFYYTLGPKYESDTFFYTYFTYVSVLEKMVDVLETKYLNDVSNESKILASYLIGLGLGHMLFTSNTSIILNNALLEILNISQNDYFTFSLKNDGFSSVIIGSIQLNEYEEFVGFALLKSDLFKQFINNEVNIKTILQEGTPVENLPSYQILQVKIYNMLSKISKKITNDRGISLNETPVEIDVSSETTMSPISNDNMNVNKSKINKPMNPLLYRNPNRRSPTTSSSPTRISAGSKNLKKTLKKHAKRVKNTKKQKVQKNTKNTIKKTKRGKKAKKTQRN